MPGVSKAKRVDEYTKCVKGGQGDSTLRTYVHDFEEVVEDRGTQRDVLHLYDLRGNPPRDHVEALDHGHDVRCLHTNEC